MVPQYFAPSPHSRKTPGLISSFLQGFLCGGCMLTCHVHSSYWSAGSNDPSHYCSCHCMNVEVLNCHLVVKWYNVGTQTMPHLLLLSHWSCCTLRIPLRFHVCFCDPQMTVSPPHICSWETEADGRPKTWLHVQSVQAEWHLQRSNHSHRLLLFQLSIFFLPLMCLPPPLSRAGGCVYHWSQSPWDWCQVWSPVSVRVSNRRRVKQAPAEP